MFGECRFLKWCAFFSALLFWIVPFAFAGAPSADVDTFRPAPGANELFTVFESTTLQQGEVQTGVLFDYAREAFVLQTSNGFARPIIKNLVAGHLTLATGLLDFHHFGIELGVDLPGDFETFVNPATTASSSKFYLGDLRSDVKFRLLDRREAPLGVALVPFVQAPTGDGSKFLGNNRLAYGGLLVIDRAWAKQKFVTSLNLGLVARPNINLTVGTRMTDQVFGSLGLKWEQNNWDFLAEGRCATSAGNMFKNKTQTPAEASLGAGYRFQEIPLAVKLGGGMGLRDAFSAPQYRIFSSLSYIINEKKDRIDLRVGRKKNKMSLIDLAKNCPRDPAQFDSKINDPDCPKYYDLRGVIDLVKFCPATPEQFDSTKHDPACQKVYNLNANLNEQEMYQIYALAIADTEAQCPKNPEDFNPKLHPESCPKIYDLKDHFSEAEWNNIVDLAAASEEKPTKVVAPAPKRTAKIKATPQNTVIHFTSSDNVLSDEAATTLSHLSETLRNFPGAQKIRVIGRTDPIGTEKMNQRVSKQRAQAVVDYLYARGVPHTTVLVPIGLGTKKPLAPNTNAEGRLKNRSVLFEIVQ